MAALLASPLAKSAIISTCGMFRYELRREWDDALPPFVLGMLNPSTADGSFNDPTIGRGITFAASNGCGSLIVWNLGAGRATKPTDWFKMPDPIGPENDAHIRRILTECKDRNGVAVVGWGAHGHFMRRDLTAFRIAREVGVTFMCLGITKTGQPKHPLYIAAKQPLVPFGGA